MNPQLRSKDVWLGTHFNEAFSNAKSQSTGTTSAGLCRSSIATECSPRPGSWSHCLNAMLWEGCPWRLVRFAPSPTTTLTKCAPSSRSLWCPLGWSSGWSSQRCCLLYADLLRGNELKPGGGSLQQRLAVTEPSLRPKTYTSYEGSVRLHI